MPQKQKLILDLGAFTLYTRLPLKGKKHPTQKYTKHKVVGCGSFLNTPLRPPKSYLTLTHPHCSVFILTHHSSREARLKIGYIHNLKQQVEPGLPSQPPAPVSVKHVYIHDLDLNLYI